jgi:hypothetical protein
MNRGGNACLLTRRTTDDDVGRDNLESVEAEVSNVFMDLHVWEMALDNRSPGRGAFTECDRVDACAPEAFGVAPDAREQVEGYELAHGGLY